MSQYTTGTVSVTNGSATVTGTGTTWSGNVSATDLFHVPGDSRGYRIQSVDSNTQITLAENYAGTTGSGKAYRITTSRSPVLGIPYPESAAGGPGDSDTATIVKEAVLAIEDELTGNGGPHLIPNGTVSAPGLAFGSDADNGIYRIGANNWGLAVGGVKLWDFSSGVAALSGSLTVTKATAGDAALFTNGGASSKKLYAYTDNIYSGIFTVANAAGSANGYYIDNITDKHFWQVNGLGAVWELTGTALSPTVDNTYNIGKASAGVKEIFCDNATINTSDARKKTAVSTLTPAEIAAAQALKKEIGWFQFLSAVAEKGDAARHHIGMTVQRAIQVMEAHDLDPFKYSFICHDAWADEFIDHPAIEAQDAIEAQPAEYEEAVRDIVVVINGKRVPVQQPYLREIKPAVEAQPAVEARPAWREQTQVAGDGYGFRVHELLLFIAAGDEARMADIEQRLAALEA